MRLVKFLSLALIGRLLALLVRLPASRESGANSAPQTSALPRH